MQTEWIWEAKANQAILTEKRSQKVWLKQDLLNRKHVYALLQRSRDIFFSLLAIIVLSPLMLLTALLIVLDDPHGGPIFSTSLGKDGLGPTMLISPFRMLKSCGSSSILVLRIK